MFLSIIIPIYNAEKHLEQCLHSCFEQHINDEYEVLCVNDGSTDKSLQILQEYAEDRPNMLVIDQPNSGVSAARNTGLRQARGDYLWFVDADDFVKPNCLQELKELSKDGADIIDFYGYSFRDSFSQEEYTLLSSGRLKGNMTYWGYAATHLYKNEIIKKHNILFSHKIKYGEDEMFYNDVLENATNVITVDNVFYLYRQHANSVMNQLQSVSRQMQRLDSILLSMKILKTGIENGKYKKTSSVLFLKDRYRICQGCLANLPPKTAKLYFEKMIAQDMFTSEPPHVHELPDAMSFKKAYLAKRKQISRKKRRTLLKKIAPSFVVRWIKAR